MSGYEFVHRLPERTECDSCGHSLWHMPDLPTLGPRLPPAPETEFERLFAQEVRRGVRQLSADLIRRAYGIEK